jgi:ParB-like chromosome segregation protein Spo0J
MSEHVASAIAAVQFLSSLPLSERADAINAIRSAIHEHSPFKTEPVDFVKWVLNDAVGGNDYNPNSVAPPEMALLEVSIQEDGYTQPIVAWEESSDHFTVVDGFHRHRVGKESAIVNQRVMGYLPLVSINGARTDRTDRIASTIRHNRARGKHQVASMSDIVIELKKRNWSDDKIGRELGMDPDEVLRLCQISGLAEVFADEDFSKSWDIGIFDDNDADLLFASEIADDAEPEVDE